MLIITSILVLQFILAALVYIEDIYPGRNITHIAGIISAISTLVWTVIGTALFCGLNIGHSFVCLLILVCILVFLGTLSASFEKTNEKLAEIFMGVLLSILGVICLPILSLFFIADHFKLISLSVLSALGLGSLILFIFSVMNMLA